MARRYSVAVLSCTRDRLSYTKHCFKSLWNLAGYPYDHYVLDQASSDGTKEWLRLYDPKGLIESPENVGIARGMNRLLDLAGSYDLYVKFDNDCELTQPDTLAQIVSLMRGDLILSPKVEGLMYPPGIGEREGRLGFVGQLGGIFMAVPDWVYRSYRYDESLPVWGMDDVKLSEWFQARGGRLAYVTDLTVNHYRTTQGQHDDFPNYFERRQSEGGPW